MSFSETRRIRYEQQTTKWQEGIAEVLEDILDELKQIRRNTTNTTFLVPKDEQETEAIGAIDTE